jgi:BRCA1-associated protein
MPNYFYHISLEVFPDSHDISRTGRLDSKPSTSTSPINSLAPFRHRPKSPGGSNRKNLHDTSPSSRLAAQGQNRQKIASPYGLSVKADNSQHQAPTPTSQEHYGSPTGPKCSDDKDLRLDKITIESIDMVSPGSMGGHSMKQVDGNISTGIGSHVGGAATKGKYLPLDRKDLESIWGIVHLYRDAEETPALDDDVRSSRAIWGRHHGSQKSSASLESPVPDEDCTTLCILAVPSYLSPSDFLGFVGEQTRDEVSHFRMIRTSRANRYMVLMKFRNGKKAREWRKEWNGKVFNDMEVSSVYPALQDTLLTSVQPETCHVVFVKSVEIEPSKGNADASFPDMTHDPFTPAASKTDLSPPRTRTNSSLGQNAPLPAPFPTSKPLAPPTPSLIELPTCPVCLERMDETTGLLTILCQHVFHCTCLQRWKGSGCPVCRYTQEDFGRRGIGMNMQDMESECSVCQAENNLWVCLICGNIGCGRYDAAHAFAHYEQTSHCFAMDLSTQRVWDYASDGYVHRIIQNKADGKLVELPAAGYSALEPPDSADSVPREKLDNIGLEYTHLLTSQLESQRVYFEEQVERAADKASQASAAALSATEAADRAIAELSKLKISYDEVATASVPTLEKDKSRAERRAEKFEAMSRKLEREWREEKTVNQSLMERIEHLTRETEGLKAEVGELKRTNEDLVEQNRDLSFFISGAEKLKELGQGEDVQEGVLSMPDPPNQRKGKGRR